jgi:hypothetical protein
MSIVLPLSLYRVENRVCLSRDVQVTCVACCAATRIMVVVGDLMRRTWYGHIGRVLGG